LFLNFLTIIFTLLFRKRKKILIVLFVIFFSLWFISGRTVGIQWTGEIYTGWFYLKYNKVALCPSSSGCSDNILRETSIKDKSFYRLSLTNKFINEEMFVGPFLYSKLKKYLENPVVQSLP